jgi:hypothetical protein
MSSGLPFFYWEWPIFSNICVRIRPNPDTRNYIARS